MVNLVILKGIIDQAKEITVFISVQCMLNHPTTVTVLKNHIKKFLTSLLKIYF